MQSKEGYIPLGYASMRGYDEVVKTLLQVGVKVDCKNKQGVTALQLAARYENYETVKVLLEAGAKVNDAHVLTALHIAAANEHAAMVKTLLEGGADPSLGIKPASLEGIDPNVNGYLKDWTALHLAASIGALEIVKLLLVAGGGCLKAK